jgi:hypothetical protein
MERSRDVVRRKMIRKITNRKKPLTSAMEKERQEFLKLDGKFHSDASIAFALIVGLLGAGPLGMIAHITNTNRSVFVKCTAEVVMHLRWSGMLFCLIWSLLWILRVV